MNAAAPMIVMLGHSEINMKIFNTNIKTMKSNDYRKVSENNRDTNSILAII